MWALSPTDYDIMHAQPIHATQTMGQCELAELIVTIGNEASDYHFFCIPFSQLTSLRVSPLS